MNYFLVTLTLKFTDGEVTYRMQVPAASQEHAEAIVRRASLAFLRGQFGESVRCPAQENNS